MKIVRFIIIFIVLLCALLIYLSNQPTILRLSFKGNSLYCEIADNDAERNKGLMFRDSLAENAGMVFVYQDEKKRTFHMPNVKMPLAIVFADRNGIIVNMTEMIVDETTTYPSEKEVMYAVEANKGWFTSHQIKIGDKIEGLPLPQ